MATLGCCGPAGNPPEAATVQVRTMADGMAEEIDVRPTGDILEREGAVPGLSMEGMQPWVDYASVPSEHSGMQYLARQMSSLMEVQRRIEGSLRAFRSEVKEFHANLGTDGAPVGPMRRISGVHRPRSGSVTRGTSAAGLGPSPSVQMLGPYAVSSMNSGHSSAASAQAATASQTRRTSGSEVHLATSAEEQAGELEDLQSQTKDGDARSAVSSADDSSSSSEDSRVIAATLPKGWPGQLEMQDGLHFDGHKDAHTTSHHHGIPGHGHHRRTHAFSSQQMSFAETKDWDNQDMGELIEAFSRYVLNPDKWALAVFDVISFVLLVVDFFYVPLQWAFEMEFEGLVVQMAAIGAVWWAIDIFVNFNTGLYDNGNIVTSRRVIARHYMATWFSVDILCVLCDWSSFFIFLAGGDNPSFTVLTTARILRTGAIVRLARWMRISDRWQDRLLSSSHRLAFRCVTLLLGFLVFNHLICCLWLALGRDAYSDTGHSWLEIFAEPGDVWEDFQGFSRRYKYFTAMHLTLGQMLGEISPAYNTAERIYCSIGLLGGLLTTSAIISSLSAALVELQMAKWDHVKKLHTLQQFLSENAVQKSIAVGVQKQIIERLSRKERLRDEDVVTLELLSSTMRSRLRFEIYGRPLVSHPLFRVWSRVDEPTVQSLTCEDVDFAFLMPGDELFIAGEICDTLYRLNVGELTYVQEPGTSPVRVETKTTVKNGAWLCEAALWCKWTTVGNTVSGSRCEVFRLHCQSVIKCLQRRSVMGSVVSDYGVKFYQCIVSAKPPLADYPSDIAVPFTEYGDIVTSLSTESQLVIAVDALKQLNQKSRFANLNMETLREEVGSGKSTLLVNSAGDAERVVAVVTLRVEDDSSRRLAQIGKFENGKMIASCQLPGGKQERGEGPADAVNRLLKKKLYYLSGIKMKSTEREVEWKESKEHGLRTKYMKTIMVASVEGSLYAPTVGIKTQSIRFESPGPSRVIDVRESNNAASRVLNVMSQSLSPSDIKAQLSGSSDVPGNYQDFREEDVYVFESDGKFAFYAWLTSQQFAVLSKPAGEPMLKTWVNSLNFEAEFLDKHVSGQEALTAMLV